MDSLVLTLRFSGVAVILLSIVLGALVTPALFAIALVGIGDLVLARLFASGRIGSKKAADPVAQVEADPSFNPYARED